MSDIDQEEWFDDLQLVEDDGSNIVSVFKDIYRIGHRRDMTTQIENGGRLTKTMERINNADPEVRVIGQLQEFYYSISTMYNFASNDLNNILELFQKVPHRIFKHPQAFILGYVLHHSDLKTIQRIISHSQIQGVSEIDAIRYYRLIQNLKQQ